MQNNPKTTAAINALEILGCKYIKRTAAHCYFNVPSAWSDKVCGKLANEFIKQTGIGVKMRRV
jgi:hypothetical protein